MALKRVYSASQLAAPPADASLDIARMRPDKPAICYGWNLSPFVIQIQDEGGNAIVIALPFCPFKAKFYARTEKLIIHVDSAAMVPASPLAAADLRFWIEVSEFDQELFPGPW